MVVGDHTSTSDDTETLGFIRDADTIDGSFGRSNSIILLKFWSIMSMSKTTRFGPCHHLPSPHGKVPDGPISALIMDHSNQLH